MKWVVDVLFSGELIRDQLRSFKDSDEFTAEESKIIEKAYNKGWWMQNISQIPLIYVGITALTTKHIYTLPLKKKVGVYLLTGGGLSLSYLIIGTIIWNYCYQETEPIFNKFFEEYRQIENQEA